MKAIAHGVAVLLLATAAFLGSIESGELPAAGQHVELGGWRYTVETASGRRATRVRIERAG